MSNFMKADKTYETGWQREHREYSKDSENPNYDKWLQKLVSECGAGGINML